MEGTANCPARSPDCCDLQEGGGGESHCPHFEKGRGGCIKRRWVSWYVTRLPQQPHSLRNQHWRSSRSSSRSGGGQPQQLVDIYSQLFVVMATAETQTFHHRRFHFQAKNVV